MKRTGFAAVFTAVGLVMQTFATVYTWNPAVREGAWSDPGSWRPSTGVPKTGDNVTFTEGTTAKVTLDADVTINALTADATGMDVTICGEGRRLTVVSYNGLKLGTQNKVATSTTRIVLDGLVCDARNSPVNIESGATLVVTNGASFLCNTLHMCIDNGSTLYSGDLEVWNDSSVVLSSWLCLSGNASVRLVNGRLDVGGAVYYGDGSWGQGTGGSFRFEGDHPELVGRDAISSWNNSSNKQGGQFDFLIPEGGYRSSPVRIVGTGAFGNSNAAAHTRINVLTESPALAAGTQTRAELVQVRGSVARSYVDFSGATPIYTALDGVTEAAKDADVRCVFVTVGEGEPAVRTVDRSSVEMYKSITQSHRTLTAKAMVAELADGLTTRITCLASEAGEGGPYEVTTTTVTPDAIGDVSLAWVAPKFDQLYYLKLRVEDLDGDTVVNSYEVGPYSATTRDNATYTWAGGARGAFDDPASWSDNKDGDCIGIPTSSGSVALFPAETTATVDVLNKVVCGKLNLSASGLDVTFVGSKRLEMQVTPTFGGSGCHDSTVTFAGVDLYTGQSVTVDDGIWLRFRNQAKFYLGSLSAYKSGTLELQSGTAMDCGDLSLGSTGSVIIDDASVNVRGHLYAGHNNAGGRLVFRGKAPSLYSAGKDCLIGATISNGNVCHFDFEIPVGGYLFAPITCISTKTKSFGLPNGANTGKVQLNISSASPALFVDGAFATPLVKWSASGFNKTYTVLGDDPGASPQATLAYDGNAVVATVRGQYPVDTVVVRGSPFEIGAPTPAYGVATSGLKSGDTVPMSMASTHVETAGIKADLLGYEIVEYAADGTPSVAQRVGGGTSSFTYTHGTKKADVRWLWSDCVYRVNVEADAGGSVEVADPWVTEGGSITLTASVSEGCTFLGWGGDVPDDQRQNQTVTLTVNGPLNVYAAVSNPDSPVYLKSGATGFGSGTSWNNAYTDFATAAAAAAAAGKPLWIAGGLYDLAASYTLADGFAVYGGFPGVSADETLDDRDPDRWPSVLCGDIGHDNYWQHVEPERGAYSCRVTDLKAEPLVKNGALNLPPATTGDLDTYAPVPVGTDVNHGLFIGANVGGVLDGITLLGFSGASGGNGCAIQFDGATKPVTIERCRLIGNSANIGALYVSDKNTGVSLVGTRFLYNTIPNSARAACIASHGSYEATDCEFIGSYRKSTSSTCALVLYWWGTVNQNCSNCTFTRNVEWSTQNGNANYGGPSVICGAEGGSGSLRSCTITNNTAICYSTEFTSALTEPTLMRVVHGSEIHDCLIANNVWVCRPSSIWGFAFINARGSNCSFASDVFTNNVIYVPEVASASGTIAVGLAGCYEDNSHAAFVNCRFDANRIDFTAETQADLALSRGVMVYPRTPGKDSQIGIANCTFSGTYDPGVKDVIQISGNNAQPLVVANSIFTAKGTEEYDPFRFDVPLQVKLYANAVKNLQTVPEVSVVEGLTTDDVPLTADGRVAANAPGIRATIDVSTNNAASPKSFAYRPIGESKWTALATAMGGLNGTARPLIGDLYGNARPEGGFTRGAVQPMTANAESGKTLVVRREPFAAGDFGGVDAVQSIATGEATSSVTASPSSAKVQFDGWYLEDGTLYDKTATLTISSLTEDLILTAKFTPPDVNLTFDLDGAGTFEGGESSVTVVRKAQTLFDGVPAFAENADWKVLGWTPELPKVVPEEDTTYVARKFTKALRVVYVVPPDEAPEVQDGTSWETAYTDLATAYADAGTYRGQVWMKGGFYPVPQDIQMLSNVEVIGGFAGDETEASAADPVAHPVTLYGDNGKNDYWKPDGAEPSVKEGVYLGSTFNDTPYREATKYLGTGWFEEDTLYCFKDIDVGATNVVFRGLTFACFRNCAVYVNCPNSVNRTKMFCCRFLVCNGQMLAGHAAVRFVDAVVELDGCTFDLNSRAAYLGSSDPSPHGVLTNVVRNCTFRRNHTVGSNAAGLQTFSYGGAIVENCVFEDNYSPNGNWSPALRCATSYANIPCVVRDSLFVGNRARESSSAAVMIDRSNAAPPAEFVRCRFIGNRFETNTGDQKGAALQKTNSGDIRLDGCLFAGNEFVSQKTLTASAIYHAGGNMEIVNTTFVTNRSAMTLASGVHATVLANGNCSHLALVNCAFDGNFVTGGTDGADVVQVGANENTGLAVWNSVLWGEGEYRPFAFAAALRPIFAHSAVRNYDPTTVLQDGKNGFVTNMTALTAHPFAAKDVTVGEIPHRAVDGADRTLAKLGRPYWRGTDGNVYFLDTQTQPAKPWRLMANKTVFRTLVEAEALGLSDVNPGVPDAAGVARRKYRWSLGPLQPPPRGLTIYVR